MDPRVKVKTEMPLGSKELPWLESPGALNEKAKRIVEEAKNINVGAVLQHRNEKQQTWSESGMKLVKRVTSESSF